MTIANLTVFAFERAIANSPVGILVAVTVRVLFGGLLVKLGCTARTRIAIYGFAGALGTIWDYANQRPIEYGQIPLYALAFVIVASFVWIAAIAAPFVLVVQKKSFQKNR